MRGLIKNLKFQNLFKLKAKIMKLQTTYEIILLA